MNWHEFAVAVHQNAVEHGWWDEERSFGEIIALCHSELSEALEEFRAKRPLVWFACTEADPEKPCHPEDQYDCQNFGKEVECEYRSTKPEGIAVELVDCIIRILDWLGKEGIVDTDELLDDAKRYTFYDIPCGSVCNTFGEYIAQWHMILSLSYECWWRADGAWAADIRLARCINEIMEWAEKNNVDMAEILKQKHAYNKTRPYRHGGKAL